MNLANINMKSHHSQLKIRSQRGAALFVSLILLLVLTVIGLSASQRSTMQERMAANAHLQNIVFNSAESAIGGFIADANTGNKIAPGHILYELRTQGALAGLCYDQNGARVACSATTFLDGDKGKAIISRLDASVVDDCNTRMCSGFSLGQAGGGFGCRIFKVDGTGQAGNTQVTNSLWSYEVSACSK